MTVLNTADKVYLGARPADAVYAGAVKVWPTTPPTGMPADYGLWLSALALALGDGAAVTTWPDVSGNGHHATLIGSPAPTYSAADRAVLFAGQDHRMAVAGFGARLSGRTEYSLFCRLRCDDATNYPIVLTAPTDVLWEFVIEFDNSTGLYWGHGNAAYRCSEPTQPGWHTLAFMFGPIPHLFVDGIEVAVSFNGPNGDIQPAVPVLGADVLLGAYFNGSLGFVGPITDVLWYDRTLNDAERRQVEAQLAGHGTASSDRGVT